MVSVMSSFVEGALKMQCDTYIDIIVMVLLNCCGVPAFLRDINKQINKTSSVAPNFSFLAPVAPVWRPC